MSAREWNGKFIVRLSDDQRSVRVQLGTVYVELTREEVQRVIATLLALLPRMKRF